MMNPNLWHLACCKVADGSNTKAIQKPQKGNMKVKTSPATVQKLIELRKKFDISEEQFLNELPTPEKYAILAMALTVSGQYDDYELAHDQSMQTVPANVLTKCIMAFKFIEEPLEDAIQLGWGWFEVVWSNENDKGDEED